MKKECLEIFAVGLPGAATYLYMTVRGLAVNKMIEAACGSAGLSAFAAANNLLGFFWAIPGGMQAVSRLLISVSVGEEDRQTLTDIMRVMFFRYLPLMCVVIVLIIAGAPLLTQLYFHDPSSDVYRMMADGLRILPLCMPFSIIAAHFVLYRQAAGQQSFVHIMSLIDGVLGVTVFSALLIRSLGLNAVYIANILNGAATTLYILLYAWKADGHMARNIEELMAIPANFGVPETDRIDISVTTEKEVVTVAENIQKFCLEKGIDGKHAYLAGLAMEEMAGNVVSHGFVKDSRKHTVDTRVVYKDGGILLRIRDDCMPFDPKERADMFDENDPAKNIGIRMIYRMTDDIFYQNLLGLNILTIRIQ
jgi:anti-sigma regulatory factor (Ser/Thr protein kinase)